MNSGKYIFSQLLDFVNRYEFEKIVKKYNGNYRVRELNCWNQFIQLFFGQLTNSRYAKRFSKNIVLTFSLLETYIS